MKKYYMFTTTILIFLIMICPYKKVYGQKHMSTQQNEIINFKDSNLETGIREKLNKPKGDITKDDVKNIEEFILSMLSPYIESAIKQYYGEFRQYMGAGILSIEKYEGKFKLKIRVETFVGSHNPPYGIESMIITKDQSGIKVQDFKHEDEK